MVEAPQWNQDEKLPTRYSYFDRFYLVLSSFGISRDVVNDIRDAGSKLVLEAECDEDDGKIKLPEHLGLLMSQVFQDVETFTKGITATPEMVVLETDSCMIADSTPDGEGIRVRWAGVSNSPIVDKSVIFDIFGGVYLIGTRSAEGPVWQMTDEGAIDATEEWLEHQIPQNILSELPGLLQAVAARTGTRVSIYR